MVNKNILLYHHTYSQFLTSSLLATLYTTVAACLNTLRTGDADLRFYITTVQDG